MINLIKNIYRYILSKIIWEIYKRKKITATIIFPDLIPVKKNNEKINDNKDTGATKDFWGSEGLSNPDPKLSASAYLKKILKECDELQGYSESTKEKEQTGTFTSQISGFNRKRGRRS